MATKRARVNKTLEKAKKLIAKKGKKKTTKRAYPEGQNPPQSKAYNIENDKVVPAKRTGYRFTKEGAKKLRKQPNDKPTADEIEKYRNETFKVKGKVNKSGPTGVGDGSFRYLYIESRADKSDLNKARKLELGGVNPDEMLKLNIMVIVSEDDYEKGEGETVNSYTVDWLKDPQVKASDLVKYLSEELYLSENPNDYSIIDSTIHTDQLQDADGIHVNDDETLERWINGKEKLYNAHYYINVTAIKNRFPSEKELSKATGIGTYAEGGELYFISDDGYELNISDDDLRKETIKYFKKSMSQKDLKKLGTSKYNSFIHHLIKIGYEKNKMAKGGKVKENEYIVSVEIENEYGKIIEFGVNVFANNEDEAMDKAEANIRENDSRYEDSPIDIVGVKLVKNKMAKGGEMTDEAEFFYISGYWKNDKSEFKDYLVTSADDFLDDDGDDYDIFYYGMTEKDIKDAIKDGEKTDLEFVITSYSKANYSKGGVVFDPKEVRQFEKYVFSWYGKNGVAVDDMEEDIPATTAEVLKAVSQYLAFCNKTQKWGGGDSFDREVVHDIIAYNRNPKTTALFYESLINDMKKTPILEYGGILQPMIGGVNADPRFDIYNTTMFAEKGAELPKKKPKFQEGIKSAVKDYFHSKEIDDPTFWKDRDGEYNIEEMVEMAKDRFSSSEETLEEYAQEYADSKYAKGGLTRESNYLMHFEPYFEKEVIVASINEDTKTIRPSHGYFYPNKIGKKSIAWAKRNGYKFIQDGKEFEEGGKMAKGGKIDGMRERVIDYYFENDVFDDYETYGLEEEDLKDLKKVEKAIIDYHELKDPKNVKERYEVLGFDSDDEYAKGGIVKDIEAKKKSLIKKAKARGLYENFGQKEVQELQDKYGHYSKEIAEFDDWAMNFDNNELKNYAKGGMTSIYEIGVRKKGKPGMFVVSVRAKDEEAALKEFNKQNSLLPGAENFKVVGVYKTARRRMADGGEIHKMADDMTDAEYEKKFTTLNKKQKNKYDSLVSLGDSPKLALATVLLNKEVKWDDVTIRAYTMADGGMAKSGKTHEQGYDDREDERLAMRHGKIASKDFVGSHHRREHSRRDDARFETRNK